MVDVGVGVDFVVIVDVDVVELWYFDLFVGVYCQVEVVGVEYGIGMYVYVFVQFDLGDQGDLCDQFIVGIQVVVFVDYVVGVDDVVFVDDVVCVDRDEWIDMGVGCNFGVGVDYCVGVNVSWVGWCDVEQCGDFGEGGVWVFGDECGVGSGFGVVGMQYYQ